LLLPTNSFNHNVTSLILPIVFFTDVRNFIMRVLFFLAGATAATAAYVPGRAFDRFITIWLENQVGLCELSDCLALLMIAVGLHEG
jgi:hypothetical protein